MKVKLFGLLLLFSLATVAIPQTAPVTHSIKLTWASTCVPPTNTTTCDPTVSYNVYKYGGYPGNPEPPVCSSVAISSFVKITASPVIGTTYTDGPGIANGVTRCYYITALDSAGNESDPSTILSVLVVLPLAPKPSAPAQVVSVVL